MPYEIPNFLLPLQLLPAGANGARPLSLHLLPDKATPAPRGLRRLGRYLTSPVGAALAPTLGVGGAGLGAGAAAVRAAGGGVWRGDGRRWCRRRGMLDQF